MSTSPVRSIPDGYVVKVAERKENVQQPDVKVFLGEDLFITIVGRDGVFGRSDGVTYDLENGVNKIVTKNLEPGIYSAVDYQDGFVTTTRYILKNPFGKQSQLEQIKETIRAIRQVQLARLKGDDAYLQSMASDGYSFAYAPIMELEQLLTANEKRLARAITADKIKNGKSPIRTIKAVFKNA